MQLYSMPRGSTQRTGSPCLQGLPRRWSTRSAREAGKMHLQLLAQFDMQGVVVSRPFAQLGIIFEQLVFLT